jgi:hypothetical protein
MGRRIYAETVGIDKNDTYVHKFWFAIQPSSDISTYLESPDVDKFMKVATLSVSDEESIKAKVTEVKAQFNKECGLTYEQFMIDTANDRQHDPRDLLASRINLGEHLLQTIESMKAAGIEQQQLTIEL